MDKSMAEFNKNKPETNWKQEAFELYSFFANSYTVTKQCAKDCALATVGIWEEEYLANTDEYIVYTELRNEIESI